MADGYARVSGRVGVCSVHQGPGFTNALTGLTEAAKSRTPLLRASPARRPRAALRSNFRGRPARRWRRRSARCPSASTRARPRPPTPRGRCTAREVERRPVVLNLPLDVQAEEPGGAAPGLLRRARAPGAVAGARRGDRGLIAAARAAGDPRRPRRGAGRRARAARATRRRDRRGARHLGDGPRAVRRLAVDRRHLRRLRLAARGAADRRVRPGPRLRRRADALDDPRRRADRAAARRSCRSTSTRTPARTGPSTSRSSATPPRPPRRCSPSASPAPRAPRHARPASSEIAAGSWRDEPLRGRRRRRAPRPARAVDRARRAAAGRPHRRGRLRALHGLPADVPARARPAGFVFTQAFQSIGLGLASGMGAAIARPDRLDRRLPRRRRRADVAARARDARAPAAADARRGLRRRRLRRGGPPLRPAGRSRSSWCASRTPTSPRSPAPPAPRASPSRDARRPRRDRAVARAPRRPAGRRCEDHARLLRGMARGGLQVTQALSLAEVLASVDVIDLTQPLSEDDARAAAARAVREHARPRRGTRSAATTTAGPRGRGTGWRSASTSARTSTRRSTGSPAATARTSRRCRSERLVGPAVVIDKSAEAAEDPDYVLTVEDVRAFEAEHGPLPDGGWLLLRTGWDARAHDQAAFLNANETGPHTPGFDAECARWHRRRRPGWPASASRPSAPTRAPRTRSTRRSRCTTSCSARAVRAHPAGQPGAAAADRRGADRGAR